MEQCNVEHVSDGLEVMEDLLSITADLVKQMKPSFALPTLIGGSLCRKTAAKLKEGRKVCACLYVCVHVCTCLYVCMYMCVCVCVYVCVCCTCLCIHVSACFVYGNITINAQLALVFFSTEVDHATTISIEKSFTCTSIASMLSGFSFSTVVCP